MRIFNHIPVVLVMSLVLAACTTSREAQPSEASATAPSTTSMEDELVEKSMAAQGGIAQMQTLQSLEWTGEVVMPQMGMTLPLKLYQKRPGMVRSEVDIEQMGATVVSAYDGETAWTINPMQSSSPQKLPDEMATTMKEQADIDGILANYEDKGYALSYVGEAEVNGAAAHQLRLLRADSSEVMLYLDASSYLPIKQTGEGPNPMSGSMTQVETYISDYRDVNGVQMPFQIEVHMGGQVFQRVNLSGVKVNEAMDNDLFAFPVPGQKKSIE